MAHVTTTTIESAFAAIERAALAGERCPQTSPFGPLNKRAMTALYKAGRIRVGIYRHNYRVALLLDGPHKGKRTAPPPTGGKPYKVVGG